MPRRSVYSSDPQSVNSEEISCQSNRSLYSDSARQVATLLSRTDSGMKLCELISSLRVSRQTLLRWLVAMEKAGMVYRTFERNEKRGRPEGIYHLRKELFWEENELSESIRIITDADQILEKRLHFADTALTKLDSCADWSGPALSLRNEKFVEVIYGIISRGVKFRYITEIIGDNIVHCNKLLALGVEVRHMDSMRANFAVTDGEYHAAIFFGKTRRIPQLFFSNKLNVVISYQRIFDELWEKAIPATLRFKELEGNNLKGERSLLEPESNRNLLQLEFQTLAKLCKFRSDGRCLLRSEQKTECEEHYCPFLTA